MTDGRPWAQLVLRSPRGGEPTRFFPSGCGAQPSEIARSAERNGRKWKDMEGLLRALSESRKRARRTPAPLLKEFEAAMALERRSARRRRRGLLVPGPGVTSRRRRLSNTVTPAQAGVQGRSRSCRTFCARHLRAPASRGHDRIGRPGRCARPEMAPQAAEIIRSPPGNGAGVRPRKTPPSLPPVFAIPSSFSARMVSRLSAASLFPGMLAFRACADRGGRRGGRFRLTHPKNQRYPA
jgi:hypothetical protein